MGRAFFPSRACGQFPLQPRQISEDLPSHPQASLFPTLDPILRPLPLSPHSEPNKDEVKHEVHPDLYALDIAFKWNKMAHSCHGDEHGWTPWLWRLLQLCSVITSSFHPGWFGILKSRLFIKALCM